MGLCYSCFGRRRRPRDPERDPLLPASSDSLPPPKTNLDKAADVLGALHVGKLPSQDQLNAALRNALRSELLTLSGKAAYGPLSEGGRRLITDSRELVEAILQVGMEKNSDDTVQEMVHQTRTMSKHPVAINLDVQMDPEASQQMQKIVDELPARTELISDTELATDAVKTLSRLLLTSSTFRILLSDVLVTTREIVADASAQLGNAAAKLQERAAQIETNLRPGMEAALDDLQAKARIMEDEARGATVETVHRWEELADDAPNRIKYTAVERVQAIIRRIQDKPEYQSSIMSLLFILRKYTHKAQISATAATEHGSANLTVDPIVDTDEHLVAALHAFKTTLERFASGRKVDSLVSHVKNLAREAASPEHTSGLDSFLADAGQWLDRALRNPAWASSRSGTSQAEDLYDRGRELLAKDENSAWAEEARALLTEMDNFTAALTSDKSTARVVQAFRKIGDDTAGFSLQAAKAPQTMWKDLLSWALPRLMAMLPSIPLPRFELVSDQLDLVIDAALITCPEATFAPDHVIVQNYSEYRLDTEGDQGAQTFSRFRIHIDGLRIAIHDVGYYVKWKGPLNGVIGWEDEGLVSVDVGQPGVRSDGLSIDLEVEVETGEDGSLGDKLFALTDVKVSVPGLAISIDKSKHWIFNKTLLQPLAGPTIRTTVGFVLEGQIRKGFDKADHFLAGVHKSAVEHAGLKRQPSWQDYWNAFLSGAGSRALQDAEVLTEEETPDEPEQPVETSNSLTVKGFVHTSTILPDETPTDGGVAEEGVTTQMAVGLAPQLLPGKGGPHGESLPDITESSRDAVAQISNIVAETTDNAYERVSRAGEVRRDAEHAEDRMKVREQKERTRSGWRSPAFDLR